MGLGVLEDKVLDHVPGTTRYFDDPDRPQTADTADARGLKCDRSGPVPIILVRLRAASLLDATPHL